MIQLFFLLLLLLIALGSFAILFSPFSETASHAKGRLGLFVLLILFACAALPSSSQSGAASLFHGVLALLLLLLAGISLLEPHKLPRISLVLAGLFVLLCFGPALLSLVLGALGPVGTSLFAIVGSFGSYLYLRSHREPHKEELGPRRVERTPVLPPRSRP